MRSWEEKINGETEEKKMNRQADFTDGSSSFDDGFDKLYEKIKTMYRDDELETVKRAYDMAKEHHKNQLRQSGEPYIIHPIAVASILADLGMDSQSVAAALLHDTVEDTDVTKADIEREFGDEIAQLVDGVTKLAKVPTETKAEAQAENIRKMLLAMSNDIRVIIIKLADRLHNMRTIGYVREEKRRETALETLEIYAPIAHRLGIRTIKEELEDRAIICLDPVAYKEIEDYLNSQSASRKEFLDSIIEKIKERVDPLVSGCKVEGRIKSVHGIYRKMYIGGKTFDEIYDIYAVRIIVESVIDCYNCLGVIHDMFRPIPNRFKDYISTPKPNMYQSLHTTVIGKEGIPFEVQIRTWEMHQTAEYGIAAHWKYKENKEGADSFDKRLSWIREVMEWQGGLNNSTEFIESLKGDVYNSEVLVFTPKGEVIALVKDATPIDFAYRIHTEVGNKCVGAKVNGKIVPLNTTLCVGDVVEIITSKLSKGPSWDWLRVAKSSGAKAKIKAFFKKSMAEDKQKLGKAMLESEAKNRGYVFGELLNPVSFERVGQKLSFSTVDEMYAAVGCGAVSVNQVLLKLIDFYRKEVPVPEKKFVNRPQKPTENAGGVKIKGMEGLLVRFAGCCNPVPGDDIVGYVSRGRGITVHRRDCPNMRNEEPERLLEAEWTGKQSSYSVSLKVIGGEDAPILVTVSNICTSCGFAIIGVNGRIDGKNHHSIVDFTIKLNKKEDLDLLISKVRQSPDILDVFRTLT